MGPAPVTSTFLGSCEGPLPDRLHLLPGLGDDRCRLEQHAEQSERAVHLHGVLRLDSPPFGHEAVDLLDAALRVLAIAAHVPLAHGAVRTGHRVRTPHDADDQVAFLQAVGHLVDARPSDSWPSTNRLLPRRPSAAFDDRDVRPAGASAN
jgi:hypothetical protein